LVWWILVEGYLMMTIPSEKDKSKVFSLFSAIVSTIVSENLEMDQSPLVIGLLQFN
jgi:hypothetical protein